MTELVADTSVLVSLGIVDDHDPSPLALLEREYDLLVPNEVDEELTDVASYDDEHGRAAQTVRSSLTDDCVLPVELDREFPLDDGENAAVCLANERASEILLCDEFNSLGLIHASLANTRLVTTPTLLSIVTKREQLSQSTAAAILNTIADARSWDGNSYVQRARSQLENG